MSFPRHLWPSVQRAALDAIATRDLLPIPQANFGGETSESKSIYAPAANADYVLGDTPLVPDTLELERISDGHVYLPWQDYYETASGFINLRIPAGEALTAEYVADTLVAGGHKIEVNGAEMFQQPNLRILGDVTGTNNAEDEATELVFSNPAVQPPETAIEPVLLNSWEVAAGDTGPALYYRDRLRVYFGGVLTAGTVTAGTVLFTLPDGYRPVYECWLSTLSDAGPVLLTVQTTGDVVIGDGPVGAGNDWLTLDGISFRYKVSSGLYPTFYPDIARYPRS